MAPQPLRRCCRWERGWVPGAAGAGEVRQAAASGGAAGVAAEEYQKWNLKKPPKDWQP